MTRKLGIIIILVMNIVVYYTLWDNISAMLSVYASMIMVLLSDISLSISTPKKDPWEE